MFPAVASKNYSKRRPWLTTPSAAGHLSSKGIWYLAGCSLSEFQFVAHPPTFEGRHSPWVKPWGTKSENSCTSPPDAVLHEELVEHKLRTRVPRSSALQDPDIHSWQALFNARLLRNLLTQQPNNETELIHVILVIHVILHVIHVLDFHASNVWYQFKFATWPSPFISTWVVAIDCHRLP